MSALWAWIRLHPQRLTSALAGLTALLQGYASVVTKLLGENGMTYALFGVALLMYLLAQLNSNAQQKDQ
ncbi:hypothetical protein UFOVP154_50 [uncultured Caudovirales phage]|uniref:Uncharacterized protein n=1 Tax=uncultured Caudovirales phage TaxID=2100421 RepID=A0A6J7W8R5_9CAUD|nr:hypothetical protein UFOVP8_35 [uncultured Caudovirales phage]CAB5170810.1 hypothetical protein UFOVP154_50 [uncultured Caudovirales phage]